MNEEHKWKFVDKALNYLSIAAIGLIGLACWSAWFY